MVLLWLMTGGWAGVHAAQEIAQSQKIQQYKESFWKLYTDALRGDRVAQYQVGVMHERGLGVEKDEKKAAEWYEKAAVQGYVDAQYNIAIMYASGRGVAKNEPIAMMWLALAAKQGDREARKLLLDFIDGKVSKEATETSSNGSVHAGNIDSIEPVRLVCKEESVVCTKTEGKGECTPYKAKTVFTSTSKQGKYYKISGIITEHKWKDYPKEGWIDEESVEARR